MDRNKRLVGIVAAVLLVVASGFAVAEGEREKHEGVKAHDAHHGEMTVRGEILDMACFLAHGAKGPDHAACAKRCVKGGQPMGLLAEDGTVYLLYAKHDDDSAFLAAKEHAGENVEITGAPATQAGMRGIEVSAVKAL